MHHGMLARENVMIEQQNNRKGSALPHRCWVRDWIRTPSFIIECWMERSSFPLSPPVRTLPSLPVPMSVAVASFSAACGVHLAVVLGDLFRQPIRFAQAFVASWQSVEQILDLHDFGERHHPLGVQGSHLVRMDFVRVDLLVWIRRPAAGGTHVLSEGGRFGTHAFDHPLFLVEVGERFHDSWCVLFVDEWHVDVLVVPELGFCDELPVVYPPGEGLQAEDIFHDRASVVVIVSWFGDVLDEDVGVHSFDGVVDVERFASVLQHLGILQRRQHECRQVFWEEGMFVWAGVSAEFPVHLFGFSQDVIEQGHPVPVGIESRHGHGPGSVDDIVVSELRSHEQSEDDAVFLSQEGLSYPRQGELCAEICAPSFFLHGSSFRSLPSTPSFPFLFLPVGRGWFAPDAQHGCFPPPPFPLDFFWVSVLVHAAASIGWRGGMGSDHKEMGDGHPLLDGRTHRNGTKRNETRDGRWTLLFFPSPALVGRREANPRIPLSIPHWKRGGRRRVSQPNVFFPPFTHTHPHSHTRGRVWVRRTAPLTPIMAKHNPGEERERERLHPDPRKERTKAQRMNHSKGSKEENEARWTCDGSFHETDTGTTTPQTSSCASDRPGSVRHTKTKAIHARRTNGTMPMIETRFREIRRSNAFENPNRGRARRRRTWD
eukprot:scaffold1645_cov288-Pavlova_lutheri.AAC.13